MSILTCTANMLPRLHEDDRARALYHGLLHVARECAGKAPRFTVDPLPTGETRPEVFAGWFRNFIDVRDDEGAERCLVTVIELGHSPRGDRRYGVRGRHRPYLLGTRGHVVDSANKAFELLDHVGWEMAGQVLPSLVHGMAGARRSQELSEWRHPIDIASMVWQVRAELPELYRQGRERAGERPDAWDDADALASSMLGDSPSEIIASIKEAVVGGATPEQLGGAVAHAAFLRMAHFHTSNEFRDWDTVHNTLTAANALHQALDRAPTVELLRGVFDVAMSVYLDRFLNMPPQRLPDAASSRGGGADVLSELLEMVNLRQQVEGIGPNRFRLPGRRRRPAGPHGHHGPHDAAGKTPDSTPSRSSTRPSGSSSPRQASESGRHVMIGLSRFLAAHSPTPRAEGQTYQIALRLQRGEEIYQ